MGIFSAGNIFSGLPDQPENEEFQDLVRHENVVIERIVSHGHTSPAQGWYDQKHNEWVMVLQGRAVLEFEHGARLELEKGDYVQIPARTRHRVAWTDPDRPTVWLAVHY